MPSGSRDELREISKGGSTKELQVAHFFSDLELQDLLEDFLSQCLLDDSHPLQLFSIQTQQSSTCDGVMGEGLYIG